MYVGKLSYWVSTASGAASEVPCDLHGYVLTSGGAAAGTVAFLNGSSAGTEQWGDVVTATDGEAARVMFTQPLRFEDGIYVELTNVGQISVLKS